MQWENLKSMKCPKCAGKIAESKFGYTCGACGFYISYEKFQEMIKKLYQKKIYSERTEERNARWLNEL
jgi:ribosomal protein S27AE